MDDLQAFLREHVIIIGNAADPTPRTEDGTPIKLVIKDEEQ